MSLVGYFENVALDNLAWDIFWHGTTETMLKRQAKMIGLLGDILVAYHNNTYQQVLNQGYILNHNLTVQVQNLLMQDYRNMLAILATVETAQDGIEQAISQNVAHATNIITQVDNRNTQIVTTQIGQLRDFNNYWFQTIYNALHTNDFDFQKALDKTQARIFEKIEDSKNDVKGRVGSAERKILFALGLQTIAFESTIGTTQAAIGLEIAGATAQLNAAIGGVTSTLSTQMAAQTRTILAAMGAGGILSQGQIIAIIAAIGAGLVALFKDSLPNMRRVVNNLVTNQYTSYDEFLTDWDTIGGTADFTKTVFDAIRLPAVIISGLLATSKPYVNNLVRLAATDAQPNWLTPDESLLAFHKLQSGEDFAREKLLGIGYREQDVETIIQSSFTLLPMDILRNALLRGFISHNEHDLRLRKLGFNTDSVAVVKELYNVIPNLQDIITIAVREGFTPEIAQTFGQYDELPGPFVEWSAKQGLNEFWARALWAAHWNLPAPEQGFRMFQRGIISLDELNLLLRANDIMPFWREKLIQLNYTPLRLVDIRRFHAEGVLSDSDLPREFMTRGYSPQNAQRATEWTIRYNSKGSEIEAAEMRSLSRSVIVQAFKLGYMSFDVALARLVAENYTPEDAQLLLAMSVSQEELQVEEDENKKNKDRIQKIARDAYLDRVLSFGEAFDIMTSVGLSQQAAQTELDFADYEFSIRYRAHIVDWYRDLYTQWSIDIDEFSSGLASFGFSNEEIEQLLIEYDVLREVRTRKLTLAQVARFFNKQIITLEQAIVELKGLGYRDHYIVWILEDIGIEQ